MTLELEQAALPCFPGSGPTVPSPKSSVSLSPDRYSSEQEFVDDLKNMWFGLYSRGSEEGDSSGFEHVFSGGITVLGKKGERVTRDASLRRRAAPRRQQPSQFRRRVGHVSFQAKGAGFEDRSLLEYLREKEDQIPGLPRGTHRKGDGFEATDVCLSMALCSWGSQDGTAPSPP